MSAAASYADRSVLVTGGLGFIGSWLVERLLDEGARVLVPQRPASERSRFVLSGLESRCDAISLDLLDFASLLRVLEEHEVDAVFHLAAHTVVGEADRSPLPAFETNIRGTYNLLEACRMARGKADRHVVIASSAHVYGKQQGLPCPETAPLRPAGPYDVSKACVDMIARCYAVTHDMPIAVTRISNVYGGGDLNFSRLVPSSVRALVAGNAPVIESDGTPERDYLYVEDAVDAYLAVERSLSERELWGRAWNAGGDTPIAAREVVRTLIGAAGADLEPEIEGRPRSGDGVDARWLDSGEIRSLLGWAPRWAPEAGLQKTYAWYQEHL